MATVVLQEDFDSTADWTSSGTVAAKTGRTGLGVQLGAGTSSLTYNIAAGAQSDTITVGFAFKLTSIGSNRAVAGIRSDSAATQHLTIVVTTTGALDVRRGTVGGTVLATSAASAIAINTWYYVELKAKLHDTTGTAVLRLNGTQVGSSFTGDTKNAGTKTVFDSMSINAATGVAISFDDLYIITGTDSAFAGVSRFGTGPTDVIHEPFANLSAWTTSGSPTPTVVSGRTGSAVELSGSGAATLTIAASPAVLIGFALYVTGPLANTDLVDFRIGGASQFTLRLTSTGVLNIAGSFAVTPAATIVADTWQYVEAMVFAHAGGGFATIRVNDTVVGTSIDGNIPGSAGIDTVRLAVTGAVTARFDDLYLLTGTLADFEGDQTIGPTGVFVNVWNGTAFVDAPIKVWNGSAFVDAVAVKVWNGSAFVDAA